MEMETPAYFTSWLWGITPVMYVETLYHNVLSKFKYYQFDAFHI